MKPPAASGEAPAPRRCRLLLPGDWSIPTGGYRYDRRMARALEPLGWRVEPLSLGGAYPAPGAADRDAARAALARLPDGEIVLADGLAYGALPELARAEAMRLGWIALVHHPLHLESGLDPARAEHLRRSEAEALRWARRVIVTSARSVGDLRALGVPGAGITVIEPGTDPGGGGSPGAGGAPARGEPPPAGSDAALEARHARLLCVASLTPRKDHASLLQALARLAERLPDLAWRLDLVGSEQRDPATARALRRLATDLGLDGHLHWHGEIDEARLQRLYRRAGLFVLPSRHEGYGMAVAEALAHGLPVIASDAGALVDTLPADAGLHPRAGDVAALTAALRRWFDEPGLRRACRAGAIRAAARLPRWPEQALKLAAVLDAVRRDLRGGPSAPTATPPLPRPPASPAALRQ